MRAESSSVDSGPGTSSAKASDRARPLTDPSTHRFCSRQSWLSRGYTCSRTVAWTHQQIYWALGVCKQKERFWGILGPKLRLQTPDQFLDQTGWPSFP